MRLPHPTFHRPHLPHLDTDSPMLFLWAAAAAIVAVTVVMYGAMAL